MKRRTKILIFILAIFAIGIWSNIAKSPADTTQPLAHLFVMDVGQGDAILIAKGTYQILVDGGPDADVLNQLGKIMPPTDKKIEKMILTHPHADHLAGLNAILERYEVDGIVGTGVNYDSVGYREYKEKVKNLGKAEKIPEIGEKESVFDNGEIQYLWPGSKVQGQEIVNLNNTSLTMRFCYFTFCAFLPGDLETDEQALMFSALEKQNIPFQSDVLKISHHGSSNGTDALTLEKVMPKYAAISVGKDNKFGHPHQVTLDLLQNIQTNRTDQNGTIEYVFSQTGVIKK